MDVSAGVEKAKDDLVASLNKTFPNVGLLDLPRLAEAIEALLQIQLRNAIFRLAPRICHCRRSKDGAHLVENTTERMYTVGIGPDLLRPDRLLVVFLDAEPSRPADITKSFDVVGHGQFLHVCVHAPRTLPIDLDAVGHLSSSLLACGYAWFQQEVENLAAGQEIYLARDLYEYVKTVIPEPDLMRNMWFGCVTTNYGFRLIDPQMTREAFDILSATAPAHGHSANRLLAELISTRLPAEGLLMKVSADLSERIDGEIAAASYSRDGTVYASSMSALYDSSQFRIYPVFTSRELSVLALFPCELRAVIEERLQAHCATMQTIIERSYKTISSAQRLFEKRKPRFDLWRLNKVFDLKPNIAGFGVNLNEALEMLRPNDPGPED